MEQDHQEMQLLSYSATPLASSSSYPPPWPARAFGPSTSSLGPFHGPSLDLQLSISVSPLKQPSDNNCVVIGNYKGSTGTGDVEALKWEAAEQIRLAAMEKAYAEHMMELTRREMELAQSEFLRARTLWERAREEVERAEKMRERATSACMEITCLSCRQRFRP